ncbi:MAG: PhoU domain-containing protein [Phascolarctobacterium faecium]|jgi:phosphate:Na+ symporter
MIYEDNVKFSDEAKAELHTLGQMVLEASGKALEALEKDDKKLAEEAWALCRQVKQYQKEIRKNHIVRLNEKRCDPVAGFVMLELLINMKRVSDHSKNISQLVLGIF